MLIAEVTEEPKAKKAKGQAKSSTNVDPDDFEVHGTRSFPSGLVPEERHGGVGKAEADAKSSTRPEPEAGEEEDGDVG